MADLVAADLVGFLVMVVVESTGMDFVEFLVRDLVRDRVETPVADLVAEALPFVILPELLREGQAFHDARAERGGAPAAHPREAGRARLRDREPW